MGLEGNQLGTVATTRPDHNFLQRLLNLATGVRMTTIDLEKAELMEMRDIAKRFAEDYPETRTFTNVYVPAEKKATTDPEVLSAVAMQQRLNRAIQELMQRRDRSSPGRS